MQSLPEPRLLLQVMSHVGINSGMDTDPDRKATLLEKGFELMDCSKKFLHEHMVIGDNGNKNPWGELPKEILARKEENPDSIARLEGYWKPACGVPFPIRMFTCATSGATSAPT